MNQYARENGLLPSRVYQRVYCELFCGLLAEAQAHGVIPMYLLKGGMALELRFGIRARASKDVDVGIISGADDLLAVFERVLVVGFAGFTFRLRDNIRHLENAVTYRLRVQILYAGRAFGTLDVDLNEADHESASDVVTTGVLTGLGLPGPLSVPVLDSHLQIAHKLHGATEPSRPDYENLRYRDVIDVLTFSRDKDLQINFQWLREVVIAEFARRKHHRTWPPIFELPQRWREPIQNEAKANDFPINDADELSREFVAFIAKIEGIDLEDSIRRKDVDRPSIAPNHMPSSELIE